MHSQIIAQDYSKNKKFNYFLCSDLHFGNKAQDKKLLQKEFDHAKEIDAKIFINGDWGDFIISGDRKRYHPGGDKYGNDNAINETINEAFEFLKNYAENIVFIGHGNHETAVSKYHAADVTKNLIFLLNRECKTNIAHGQYSGFIMLKYSNKNATTRTKILYYNHGQGGGAEISKGAIDLNRHMSTKYCDVVWIGHKHTKLTLPCENMLYVDRNGNINVMQRTGVVTGSYLKIFDQYDAMDSGYRVNYGEETKRTLQSTGGVFLEHVITGKGSQVEQKIIM